MRRSSLLCHKFWLKNLILLPFIFYIFFILTGHVICAEEKILKFTNVLYRHGDRSPIRSYANDLYNESFWPQGYGQLTKIGMLQEFELGQWLRTRYQGFISAQYRRQEVTVYSTNFDRTIQSALSNLAGFYYPTSTSSTSWNLNLTDWNPIPVFSYFPEVNTDPFAGDRKSFNCPKYRELYKRDQDMDPVVAKVNMDNKDFLSFLSNMTGEPVKDIFVIHEIIDPLICQRAHNLTLPAWASDKTVWDKMEELHNIEDRYICKSKAACRLRIGLLVKAMIDEMQLKISKSSYTKRMTVYSAHDSTISAFLSALGLYDHGVSVAYTTAVLVELYEEKGEHSVEVYLKVPSTPPAPQPLPGCPSPCLWQQYLTLTYPVVPVDLMAECGIHTFNIDDGNLITILTALTILFILLFILVLCLCVKMMVHRRKSPATRTDRREDIEYTALQDTSDY